VTLEPFVVSQRVRPRHCDAQAMVYAGRYHEFCEDAFICWLENLNVSYASLRAQDVDLVISESQYSFRRPARLDDELLIAVTGEMTQRVHPRRAFHGPARRRAAGKRL
jgi:YbgC/YbaW family acyl-CoA thioester hydrolase